MKQKEKRSEAESNILVAIRVRPLSQKQIANGEFDIVRVQDNLIIILDPIDVEYEDKKMLDVLHRSKEQRYAFDKIYPNQSSELIYQQTAKSLIKTVIEGKNATVFAYGPTGTGKTYTMLGNEQVYGLNVLAIRDIFSQIEVDHEYNYRVNITYVEIYNEMIRDLLVPASGYLELRDDADKGVSIAGVTQIAAESTEQVMELLLIGNKRRTTEATNANQTSSRSHAVFQINVMKTPRTKNINVETLTGKLSLIDLAGSERGTVTENRGIRLMQGAKINRSLLALANCINALGDKNKKGFFVPYRDSKLTRLLKDSLGGNSRTVMIVNISPASSQFEETINTLKYANRAKNIKTKPLTNKKLVSIHISEYKAIINDLRQEIEQLKNRLSRNEPLDALQANISHDKVYNAQNKGHSEKCNCGRLQQAEQIKKIKEKVFENFNERIQLRRALMEIEEQNAYNVMEIKKKMNEVAKLKQQQFQNTEERDWSLQIKTLNKTIKTLKLSSQKNLLKKQITNLQLAQSMTVTKKLKEEIPKKVKSKENRELLEILIKNHILQLQNIQLEINLQVQDKIMSNLRKASNNNRIYLEDNGISLDKLDEEQEQLEAAFISNKDEIELELEEEDDPDNQEAEDDHNLQESIRQINKSVHRNIIEQSYEQKYEDDFEGQNQQEVKPQLFSDDHFNEVQQKKTMDENQNKGHEVSRKFPKKANREKREHGLSKNMQINYSMGNMGAKIHEQIEDRKKNTPAVDLGIVGFNSINKKKQKTLNSETNMGGQNQSKSPYKGGVSNTSISAKQPTQNSMNLEFNLKGAGLKLNEKLPFAMAPKQKRKK